MPVPTGRTIAESGKKFIGLATAPLVRALLSSPVQSALEACAEQRVLFEAPELNGTRSPTSMSIIGV